MLSVNRGVSESWRTVPENVKFKPISKFSKKVMVWIAMSSRGVSEPYIVKSGNAINAEVYIRECLTRSKNFIDKYHSDNNYIFWPDLASSHYASITQQFYETVGIKVLPKNVSPLMSLNFGQLRHFGHIWEKRFMKMVGRLKKSQN